VKYTRDDGEIRVQTWAEGSNAVICVSDNGIGIPEDLIPRIFGLFVQNTRSLDRSEGGLGIGLSVVEKLVGMHGGTVSAASKGPGQGSTFQIHLPRICGLHLPADVADATRISEKRILVVDDNVDAASSVADLLRLDGHEVSVVYSARPALEAVATLHPDVVLLDIGLPDMNGFEVARRIRAAGGANRIIALTGYGQAADLQRGRDSGFDAHLIKPVDVQVLRRAIAGSGAGSDTPPQHGCPTTARGPI
jgi:CheY-like chemotaxis protein